ncbi:AI-2E family transporter [Planococcus sp. ISL-109]|uniref:AI-2E family transporter n=1 Tax=Planococcus sp. ISL-109 TaxID=2819166 RepID=UPI001BE97B7A|nr:AI-2E family transporter [Planococcus sp. ISL-109]MBT2581389.1 AI-2E family transporter [Planococcus sp. ISL-109]
MWIRKPFFEYTAAVLLLALTLYVLSKLDYIWEPIRIVIATLFAPLVIAGVLYYLLRPLVGLLTRRMPKVAGIGILFVAISLVLASLIYIFGPTIVEQGKSLADLAPEKVEEMSSDSTNLLQGFEFGGVSGQEISDRIFGYAESLSSRLFENVLDILGMFVNAAIVLIVVPFVLFFLLKDDDKFVPHLVKRLPEDHKAEGRKLLKDLNGTLSTFVVGQAIVAGVIGVLMYIGYLIIGLEYALTLAIFAMFLVVVPFLGPILGIIPAIFIALLNDGLFMAMKVVLVLLVVQQLEGNLVTPNVMGNRLQVHPLTIILLLLVAGALYGFIGILIAIPVYAVLKTLVHNFRLFYRLHKKRAVSQ